MKDRDTQAIWERYIIQEACEGCGEDDPANFEPARKKYCKKCRNQQKQDLRAIKKNQGEPPPPGSKCPVCEKPTQTFVPDHNHQLGADGFRGWICVSCNKAAGFLGDNPQAAMNLSDYLGRNKKGLGIGRAIGGLIDKLPWS